MGTCTSTSCDRASTGTFIFRKKHQSICPSAFPLSKKENADPVHIIRQGVLGQRYSIYTPFGQRELVYADYTASGRFLTPIEDFFIHKVAPLYANTHTEASATGAQTTALREEARSIIAQNVNAPPNKYATLFVGTGCSGAIEKMINVLGIMLPKFANEKWNLTEKIPEIERPVVFIGPFEHHSNELPWRESLATVVVIPEDKYGCPDINILEQMLNKYKDRNMKIGSFSAGSNVTGICIDTKQISILLHKHNALAFFDFAGSGAYVSINVNGKSEEESMDAIFMSPHKFIGGPGCAGVLIAKRRLFMKTPTFPGGGTVTFVGPHCQDYEENIEAREEAGTPGIVQSIRTGLVFKVKEIVGSERIETIEHRHCDTVFKLLRYNKNISLTGCDRLAYFDPSNRMPIFSFNILSPFNAEYQSSLKLQVSGTNPDIGSVKRRTSIRESLNAAAMSCSNHMEASMDVQAGKKLKLMLHPGFVVSILNDVYGIQARAGCSCAGPYGHRLFDVEDESNEFPRQLRSLILRGYHAFKPGWARVNFNYFISDDEVKFICNAITQIGKHGWKLLPFYAQEPSSGLYIHRCTDNKDLIAQNVVSLADFTLSAELRCESSNKPQRTEKDFSSVLKKAECIYMAAERALYDMMLENKSSHETNIPAFTEPFPKGIETDKIWWATTLDVMKYLKNHKNTFKSSASDDVKKASKKIKGIHNIEVAPKNN